MLKKILLVLAALVVLFLVVVALQPAEYRVTRSAVVPAAPAEVFAKVNDFHNWEAWSPWAKLDPAVRNTFQGPPAGTGAIFAWTGNDKVGEGRMTLIESRPDQLVRIKLEFIKPFASVCDTEFTFRPEGQGTSVTWTMAGRNGFVEKAFCLFMNMDKLVGGDFERGLANLKTAVEAKAAPPKP
jgi:hypothetical protein